MGMTYINTKGKTERTYDAIVVGSGISGGYAAMELCLKGYKVLMLERGRMVHHGDYPTASSEKWELPNQNTVSKAEIDKHYYKQNRLSWWVHEDNKHFINKDDEYPYDEDHRFDWIRGHHVGGRSIMWGKHCYRWSDIDFEGNLKDGIAIDWPIRYNDIKPWYDKVERFVGVAGQAEGLKQVPDGVFLKPFELNCAEQHFREKVGEKYPYRVVTPGRVAHLTEYDPEIHLGRRGKCQTRNKCWRGCPYGAYFSSQSATLPVATETGNLTIRPMSIVSERSLLIKRAVGPIASESKTLRPVKRWNSLRALSSVMHLLSERLLYYSIVAPMSFLMAWVTVVANSATILWITTMAWVQEGPYPVWKTPTIRVTSHWGSIYQDLETLMMLLAEMIISEGLGIKGEPQGGLTILLISLEQT